MAPGAGRVVAREVEGLLPVVAQNVELDRLAATGALHGHEEADADLERAKKDVHFRRYLLLHHRPGAGEEGKR